MIYIARARYIPTGNCQQSLLALPRNRKTQREWTKLWFSKDQIICVQHCAMWNSLLLPSILLELISSVDWFIHTVNNTAVPSLSPQPQAVHTWHTWEQAGYTADRLVSLAFWFYGLNFQFGINGISWAAQGRSKDSIKSHFLNLPHSLTIRWRSTFTETELHGTHPAKAMLVFFLLCHIFNGSGPDTEQRSEWGHFVSYCSLLCVHKSHCRRSHGHNAIAKEPSRLSPNNT